MRFKNVTPCLVYPNEGGEVHRESVTKGFSDTTVYFFRLSVTSIKLISMVS